MKFLFKKKKKHIALFVVHKKQNKIQLVTKQKTHLFESYRFFDAFNFALSLPETWEM